MSIPSRANLVLQLTKRSWKMFVLLIRANLKEFSYSNSIKKFKNSLKGVRNWFKFGLKDLEKSKGGLTPIFFIQNCIFTGISEIFLKKLSWKHSASFQEDITESTQTSPSSFMYLSHQSPRHHTKNSIPN